MDICLLKHPKNSEPISQLKAKLERQHLVIQTPEGYDIDDTPLPPHPDTHKNQNGNPKQPALIIQTQNLLTIIQGLYQLTYEIPFDSHTPLENPHRPPPQWTPLNYELSKTQTLLSLFLWKNPHQEFLEECLLTKKIEAGTPKDFPTTQWPNGMHISWLEILEETRALPAPLLKTTPQKDSLFYPQSQPETNHLIKSLKKGIIISMALRAPKELPKAKTLLCSNRQHKPLNNTWKSLANYAAE